MSPAENSLHRYWFWSFRLYRRFVDERAASGIVPGSDTWMYQALWLALLNVAVEGWQELQLADKDVNAFLENTRYVALLKRFRHGVAHFQKKYWDDRFDEMVREPETAVWAERLLIAMGDYFERRAIETNHPALRNRYATTTASEKS